MGAYQQMGHQSHNLLSDKSLSTYEGAILSPVNYCEEDVTNIIGRFGSDHFEMIFDPQLYFPNTARGNLPNWTYFPRDVDTADQTSLTWWNQTINIISDTVQRIRAHSVCSPSVVPRTYSPEYFLLNRELGRMLQSNIHASQIETLQTILVRLDWLSNPNISPEIASIMSASDISRAYLVIITDVEPRRELRETEEIKGAMRLIHFLENSGIQVLVGFASSDLVLWKAAGASDCATGKFFNLRRFTPGRWEPPPQGGGQMSYWFEEAIMAYVRTSDLSRLQAVGLISDNSLNNPFGQPILDQIATNPKEAWIALGWRQYMYWFANFESRIQNQSTFNLDLLLKSAEENWQILDTKKILMDEPQNDGGWLRPWRRSIIEAF
jgi:hypothetical protein